MMEQMKLSWEAALPREDRLAMVGASALTVLFVILASFGGNLQAVGFLPGVAVLLIISASYEVALVLLVVSLFVDFHFSGFSTGVLFSLPFGLAFLLSHRNLSHRHFSNPVTTSLILYGLCIIPSFMNATRPFASAFMLFNVVAFLIVVYGISISLRSHKEILRVAVLYLALVVINSFDVIIQSNGAHGRVLGFSGIMFVDYSALGVCVAVAMAIVTRGKRRVLLVAVALVAAVAMVLTQTRNTWLSTLITLSILVVYLFRNPGVVGFSRKRVVALAAVGFALLIGVAAFVVSVNQKVEERAAELTRNRRQQGAGLEAGFVSNSLISRVLIWDTALNAFLAHPIVGIGVYAFPYSSRKYSTLPPLLYKLWVGGISPHQTHLAVLAETGVIGGFGFMTFIVVALRGAFRSIRSSQNAEDKKFSFVAAMGLVYCTVSMIFTDAWLWNQGIILLGLVLGLVMAVIKVNQFRGMAIA